MKLLSRILFVVFVLVGVLVAVSNRQAAQLGLWPFVDKVEAPLFLVIVATLLIGILAGLGLGWWAGRHHRRRARDHRNKAARLDRENMRLRETVASNNPPPAPTLGLAAREQRAIDRQAALVAPDMLSPTARRSS